MTVNLYNKKLFFVGQKVGASFSIWIFRARII